MKIPDRVFAVRFRHIDKYWEVRSVRIALTNICNWQTIPLGNVCQVRFEVVQDEEWRSGQIQLLDRISFDEGKVYSGVRTRSRMTQYRAKPGDIVVSKINARKKAIGIVTDETEVGITIHFRALIPDRKIVDTKFLWLALRSDYCRNQFDVETGGIGKGEISEERLLGIQVPFPSLNIQRAIVARWENAQQLIEESNRALTRIVNDLDNELYSLYRGSTMTDVLKSKFLTLLWSNVQPWDVKSSRAAAFRNVAAGFRPLGKFVEEATELVKTWEKLDKEWAIYGVNNKEGVFFNQHKKGKEFRSGYAYKRIKKDWFFHNPTRSNVGSLGIVPDVPENAVTSPEYQVWRIKSGLIPGFVATLISTPFFLELIQFHRVGAVKQRLYVDNLLEIYIPVLPESEQKRIANAREKALSDIKEARKNMEQVSEEVEALILGTKKL